MSRRKPRLYSFAREIELGYFPDVSPGSEAWYVLASAIDAFASVCEERDLTPVRLEAVLAAARHAHPSVCGLGATRLAVMSHYFVDAGEAFAELVRSPSLQTRLFAATALSNTPADTARTHLEVALRDPEWSVRKAAAQVCGAIPLPGVLDALRAAREAERDARVRVVLQLAEDFQVRAVG